MDQSLFAAPHGLSQRTTSFIASQRQGIHRTPLRHLIALIIDVHVDVAPAEAGGDLRPHQRPPTSSCRPCQRQETTFWVGRPCGPHRKPRSARVRKTDNDRKTIVASNASGGAAVKPRPQAGNANPARHPVPQGKPFGSKCRIRLESRIRFLFTMSDN